MTDTAPARIHLLFGYTEPLGQTMRMWQDEPFDGSTEYVRADAPTSAESDVLSERRRQVEEEGWAPEHDDQHCHGELAGAASAYAMSASASLATGKPAVIQDAPPFFRFDKAWWKPTTPRRDLVKAAALILAEIERIDRAAMGGTE